MTDSSRFPKVLEARVFIDGVPRFARFDSSSIAEGLYDQKNENLVITFQTGVRYAYYDFTLNDWVKLLEAKSIGSHFSSFIKNEFEFEKISGKDKE